MPELRIMRHGLSLALLLGWGILTAPAYGQGRMRPQDVKAVKDSTVRIEVRLGRSVTKSRDASNTVGLGSGFILRVNGKEVTIVTALQVLKGTGASPGKSRDVSIYATLGVGTDAEQQVRASILATNEEFGLALLHANFVKNPPNAFVVADLAQAMARSTTLEPVFAFGIPRKSKETPAVTGSSLGVLQGLAPTGLPGIQSEKVLPFRAEGVSNPGQIGGPIVNEQGRPIGIASASDPGGAIDQYISIRTVNRAFEPQYERLDFEARAASGIQVAAKGEAGLPTRVTFRCRLNDPFGQAQKIWLTTTAKQMLKESPKPLSDGSWAPLPGATNGVELTIKGKVVSGTFELFEDTATNQTFWIQLHYISLPHGFVFSKPIAYRVGSGIVKESADSESPTTATRGRVRTPAPTRETGDPSGRLAASRTARSSSRPSMPAGQERGRSTVDPEDQPKGGFSQLKNSSTGQKSPEPEKTSRSLAKSVRTIDDLKVTELDVPSGQVLPCLFWTTDGSSFFLAEKTGLIRRVKADGFIEEARLDTQSPCGWLSLSAEGLLMTHEGTQDLWILDPVTLRVKGKVGVPSLARAIASPTGSLAFAAGGKNQDVQMSVIDLKKKEIVRQYGTRDFEGVNTDFKNLSITPDGKFLFCEGMEKLQRFRVRPNTIEYQESSERIAQNGQAIVISPDGYYVALPSGGGNYGEKPYSTRVYEITDLSKPAIVLHSGAYPKTLGFDMKAGLLYAQNHDFPLIVFLPTGLKQKEYKLGPAAGRSVEQFLAHPAGRKLFLLTESRLSFVELPTADN